jgi:hypothetical protein
VSILNPHPPIDEATPLRRLSPAAEKALGPRPAWVEFALQEALRVTDDDIPADLAERHDEYALGDERKS